RREPKKPFFAGGVGCAAVGAQEEGSWSGRAGAFATGAAWVDGAAPQHNTAASMIPDIFRLLRGCARTPQFPFLTFVIHRPKNRPNSQKPCARTWSLGDICKRLPVFPQPACPGQGVTLSSGRLFPGGRMDAPTVLVVDDDPMLRRLLDLGLQRAGFVVRLAA